MARFCRGVLVLAAGVVAAGTALVGLQYPYLCLLLAVGSAWRRLNSWRGSGSAFGTARLAGLLDIAGMLGDSGLILGRASLAEPPSRRHALRCLLSPRIPAALACRLAFAGFFRRLDRGLIRVRDYWHILTVAPSGAGKSVASIIPNLLSHPGSVVVLDPKGELYAKTAEHRRARLGHRIVRLDPFGVADPAATADTLNPLDFVDERDPGFLDEVRTLADMLVVRQGTEPDPHWNEWAVVVLAAFTSFVCGCEPDGMKRTLGLVRDIVGSRQVYSEALQAMRSVEDYGGVIRKLGELMGWLVDRELSSVMSSVQRHTAWMDSPAVAACLARSTFDPRMLRAGRVSVYLILPHDKLKTLAPLMRCWLGTILRVATRSGATEKNPVLFIIDEAAHLGKMQVLQDALTLMRGYGIRIWLFFQSLSQLKSCYGEHADEMLDNLGTQQYFGINSFDTADHLSKRLGDATILVESIGRNWSRSRPAGSGSPEAAGTLTSGGNVNLAEQGRRVIRPEEWLVLPDSVSVVFHKALPPIAAELVRYYNAPEFARGGTGRSRGPGLRAVAASLLVLLAGLGFSALASALPAVLRQAAIAPGVPTPGDFAPGAPPPGNSSPRPAGHWPGAAWAPAAPPEPDWDFEGRVWVRRPDGVRTQIAGPPPGRSGW